MSDGLYNLAGLYCQDWYTMLAEPLAFSYFTTTHRKAGLKYPLPALARKISLSTELGPLWYTMTAKQQTPLLFSYFTTSHRQVDPKALHLSVFKERNFVKSKIQWPRGTYQTDVTTFLWEYIIIATKVITKFLINGQTHAWHGEYTDTPNKGKHPLFPY